MTVIEVKDNNAITNDPCAACGERCDPVGVDAFVAGSWSLVCDLCAEREGAKQELAEKRQRRFALGDGPVVFQEAT